MSPRSGRRQRRQRGHRAGTTGNANKDDFLSGVRRFESRRHSLVIVWALCAVHGLALTFLFRPISGLFNTSPLVDQDWGLHFHHLQAMERFWTQDRALTGYNPLFMAGYPSNTIQDLSIKFFEFAALVLAQFVLTPTQGFKLTAFIAMTSVPWMLYFAAHNFFYDSEIKSLGAPAVAVLGTVYWWNSLPREMFFYGMIGFPTAIYLSIWGVSLCYRIARADRGPSPVHVSWLAFVLIVLPLHFQALLILAPPLLSLLLFEPKLRNSRDLALMGGAAALSLLANSLWLTTALRHRDDNISQQIVEQLPLFTSSDLLTFVVDYFGSRGYWTFRPTFFEKGFRLVLLILGIFGLGKMIRRGPRSLGITLAFGVVGCFLLTYFGSLVPLLRGWQPLRFKIALDLFLLIGAAYAIGRQFKNHDVAASRLVPLLLGGAVLAFTLNVVQSESSGRMRLRSELNPDLVGLIEWIKRETPIDGRILFEESGDETGFVHDGVYLSNFVALGSGRQLIGGPINLYNDRHHFAEFHSGRLFKRDIGSLSDAELRNYLSLYNIGVIAAFHPASIKRLHALPGFVTFVERLGALHLFKVNQALTWFVEGRGKVTARLNRLELSELEGNSVILKYHWIDGLKSVPSVHIEPVHFADDPIPFIKIINPPTTLMLRMAR